MQRLDGNKESEDDYELPALGRLDAETQGQSHFPSQNAAPEQKWELEDFLTQGTQLSSLEEEQLTNQPGWPGADQHRAITEDDSLGPLDTIYSPLSIRNSRPAEDAEPPNGQAAATQALQPELQSWQPAIRSSVTDSTVAAADLVPALIHKQVMMEDKKASGAKQSGLKPGPAVVDTAAAAVDEEYLRRIQAEINFDPKTSISELADVYNKAPASIKTRHVAADTTLPSMEQKDLKGNPSDYQRLAETKFLQESCRVALRSFQAFFQQFHDKVHQHQDVEWVVMVDNSGSMKNKRVQVCIPALSVMADLLKESCRDLAFLEIIHASA